MDIIDAKVEECENLFTEKLGEIKTATEDDSVKALVAMLDHIKKDQLKSLDQLPEGFKLNIVKSVRGMIAANCIYDLNSESQETRKFTDKELNDIVYFLDKKNTPLMSELAEKRWAKDAE